MDPDGVIQWLVDAPDDLIEELEDWLEDLEFGDAAVAAADLDRWWDRFVEFSGGSWHASVDREARLLLGQVAALGDGLRAGGPDEADAVCVALRDHLAAMGRSPSGLWQAELLADKLTNALQDHSTWRTLEPAAADQRLVETLRVLKAHANAVTRQSMSVPARRCAAATMALCASRLETPGAVIALVDRYFDLEAQARRESSSHATLDELLFVEVAGLAAYGATGDVAGMHELIRRVRILAEPAGESLPLPLLHVWSKALQHVDPEFAQMVALHMLHQTWTEEEQPSDEAFQAAFALFEATVALDDVEAVEELVQRWIPLALDAEFGEGAQAWLGLIDEISS